MQTDLALAGYLMQAVLILAVVCVSAFAVRSVAEAARNFHRAGMARLAADARRTSAPRADTRLIA